MSMLMSICISKYVNTQVLQIVPKFDGNHSLYCKSGLHETSGAVTDKLRTLPGPGAN